MTHLFSKRWTMLPFLLIPLLILSGCQTATEAPAPATAADTAPDTQTSGAVTVQGEVAFGPGSFNLPDATAGLAELSSYKSTLTLSFDGTEAGQPSQWSMTYVMLTGKESAERQLTIEKTGDISDLDEVFMAEADGAAYEQRGENACNANVLEGGNSLSERLEPAGFLNGVIGADEAGVETVNDVAANHFTFDERALGQLDITKSTGEMWVASDGGYIVRYLLTTNGNADYFGEGIEGTLTWDYELTDVNQPVTFALPDDCPAGMVDAPLLPDAANILNMPGILTYDTSTGLTEAAAFYQEQIPSLGWTLIGAPATAETNALMEFTQGDQILTVIITADAGVTTVNILLGKVQE